MCYFEDSFSLKGLQEKRRLPDGGVQERGEGKEAEAGGEVARYCHFEDWHEHEI